MPTVPRGLSYFTALRLPCSVGRGSGSPRQRPTTAGTLILDRTPRASSDAGHAGDFGTGSPDRITLWKTRVSQVTRSSSSSVPWSSTPPVRRRLAHCETGDSTAAFRKPKPLGSTGKMYLSELLPHGPRARCLTHLPPRCRDRSQGSLPACRAQLWPGGFCTHWMTYDISGKVSPPFLPNRPALPGRFSD